MQSHGKYRKCLLIGSTFQEKLWKMIGQMPVMTQTLVSSIAIDSVKFYVVLSR